MLFDGFAVILYVFQNGMSLCHLKLIWSFEGLFINFVRKRIYSKSLLGLYWVLHTLRDHLPTLGGEMWTIPNPVQALRIFFCLILFSHSPPPPPTLALVVFSHACQVQNSDKDSWEPLCRAPELPVQISFGHFVLQSSYLDTI